MEDECRYKIQIETTESGGKTCFRTDVFRRSRRIQYSEIVTLPRTKHMVDPQPVAGDLSIDKKTVYDFL